ALALALDVDRHLSTVGRLEEADQIIDVHAVVPDVKFRHGRVPAQAPAVGLDAGGDRGSSPGPLDPGLSRRHPPAGGEPPDRPLQRPGPGVAEATPGGPKASVPRG